MSLKVAHLPLQVKKKRSITLLNDSPNSAWSLAMAILFFKKYLWLT